MTDYLMRKFAEEHPPHLYKDAYEVFSADRPNNPFRDFIWHVNNYMTDAASKTRLRCSEYLLFIGERHLAVAEKRASMTEEEARQSHDAMWRGLEKHIPKEKHPEFDLAEWRQEAEVARLVAHELSQIAQDMGHLPLPHSDRLLQECGLAAGKDTER